MPFMDVRDFKDPDYFQTLRKKLLAFEEEAPDAYYTLLRHIEVDLVWARAKKSRKRRKRKKKQEAGLQERAAAAGQAESRQQPYLTPPAPPTDQFSSMGSMEVLKKHFKQRVHIVGADGIIVDGFDGDGYAPTTPIENTFGKSICDFIADEDRDKVQSAFNKVLDEKSSQVVTFQLNLDPSQQRIARMFPVKNMVAVNVFNLPDEDK